MRIRPEQLDALETDRRRSFEEEMLAHLKEFSPRHCEVIGDDNVRQVVRRGLSRAESYGVTNRGPVRSYLDLMILLGSAFDDDPQLPWANEALTDPSFFDPMDRAEELHARAVRYLGAVAGEDGRHMRAALRNIRDTPSDRIQIDEARFVESAMTWMERTYPQKYAYVGRDALEGLVAEAHEVARGFGIEWSRGTGVILALMYALGHGVTDDPQAPWASATLSDETVSPRHRVERLERKARLYLARAIEHLES